MKKCLAVAVAMLSLATAQAALVGRDINGAAVTSRDSNGALDPSAVFLYDTVLDITWLRDANANANNGSNGRMTGNDATRWVTNLVVGNYGNWRLPTMIEAPLVDQRNDGTTDAGFNVRTKSGDPAQYQAGQTVYSEMAHLWYATLGNLAYCSPAPLSCNGAGLAPTGWGLSNRGDFINFFGGGGQYDYWSDRVNVPTGSSQWAFNFLYGLQSDLGHGSSLNVGYALAVREGDVLAPAAVPIPAAAWLMLSGMGFLGAAARRRQHQGSPCTRTELERA